MSGDFIRWNWETNRPNVTGAGVAIYNIRPVPLHTAASRLVPMVKTYRVMVAGVLEDAEGGKSDRTWWRQAVGFTRKLPDLRSTRIDKPVVARKPWSPRTPNMLAMLMGEE